MQGMHGTEDAATEAEAMLPPRRRRMMEREANFMVGCFVDDV